MAFVQRIEKVRGQTDGVVKQQGFLSAVERASFDQERWDHAAALHATLSAVARP